MDIAQFAVAFDDGATLLIRTDFGSDAAWNTVVAQVNEPVDFDDPDNAEPGDEGYAPYVVVIDDPAFAGITGAELGKAVGAATGSGYALIADARSMREAEVEVELTVDYVDLSVTDPEDAELFDSFMGRTFRCSVAEVASIEANLSIANMDFSDFASNVDADGVFRGFAEE